MKKILISALGGSLFPYLGQQLSKKYNMFYVDSDITLRNLYPDYNFFHAPLASSNLYTGFIQNIINDYSIDIYVPLIDEEIIKAHLVKVPVLVSPRLEFCKLTLNKLELMRSLEEQGISVIKSFRGSCFNGEIPFPVFAKPIIGRGSRSIKVINTQAQLEAYFVLETPAQNTLIQEYIEGEEYTVGVLLNDCNDLLSISTKKVLKKKGVTLLAVSETNSRIEEVVHKINNKLKPSGPYNVQLFLINDEIKIFEINPRFSTTTIMSYAGGVDEISMFVENHHKKHDKPFIRPLDNIILHRRWESILYEKL